MLIWLTSSSGLDNKSWTISAFPFSVVTIKAVLFNKKKIEISFEKF